jgi:excisionase family DNA binding protein
MDIATIDDVRRIVREELRDALRESRPEGWLDTEAAAEHLSTTPNSIRDLVRRQGLPAHRAPGTARLLFRASELDAYVVGGSS